MQAPKTNTTKQIRAPQAPAESISYLATQCHQESQTHLDEQAEYNNQWIKES
jgi:hypothetical protein